MCLVLNLMQLIDGRLTTRQRSDTRAQHLPGMMSPMRDYACGNAERGRDTERGSMSLAKVIHEVQQGKSIKYSREEDDAFTTIFDYGSHRKNWQ